MGLWWVSFALSQPQCRAPDLRRHLAEYKIVLRRNAEGVSHAIEEGEHRDDVHRFGDLVFAPAVVAQLLNVVSGGTVGRIRDEPGVLQQRAFGRSEASAVEFAFQNCRYALVIGSLNPQEVGVAVESIGTAVEVGDVAGDHLLVAAGEVAFGEMDGVGEVHHLAKEVGPRAEALDDARNLGTSGACPPVIVGRKCFTRGFGIFDDANLGGRRELSLRRGRNHGTIRVVSRILRIAHGCFRTFA